MNFVTRFINKLKRSPRSESDPEDAAVNGTGTAFPRIIFPLYLHEQGVNLITHAANQGIPTSSTRSQSRVGEKKADIQVPSIAAGGRTSTELNVSEEAHHNPAAMLSDTRQKLIDRGQLKVDPSFESVREGDLIETSGRIEGADLLTQTQGLLEASTLASAVLKTAMPNQRGRGGGKNKGNQTVMGMNFDQVNNLMNILTSTRANNPEGFLLQKTKDGYTVRLDTVRECFSSPINEQYSVFVMGFVKRKLEEQDDPIQLTPDNIKPMRPLMTQLNQVWGNVYENQPLVKELTGPCLIVIPVCIH